MDFRAHPAGSLLPVQVGSGGVGRDFQRHVRHQTSLVQIRVELWELLHGGVIHMPVIFINMAQPGVLLVAETRSKPETLPVPVDVARTDAVLVPRGQVAAEHFQQHVMRLVVAGHEGVKIRQKSAVGDVIHVILVLPAAQPDQPFPHAAQPEPVVPDVFLRVAVMQIVKGKPCLVGVTHMGAILDGRHQAVLVEP